MFEGGEASEAVVWVDVLLQKEGRESFSAKAVEYGEERKSLPIANSQSQSTESNIAALAILAKLDRLSTSRILPCVCGQEIQSTPINSLSLASRAPKEAHHQDALEIWRSGSALCRLHPYGIEDVKGAHLHSSIQPTSEPRTH